MDYTILDTYALFISPKYGNIRFLRYENTVLFCAIDIAKMFEYADPGKTIRYMCNDIYRCPCKTTRGIQVMNFIPCEDVANIYFRCNNPKKLIILRKIHSLEKEYVAAYEKGLLKYYDRFLDLDKSDDSDIEEKELRPSTIKVVKGKEPIPSAEKEALEYIRFIFGDKAVDYLKSIRRRELVY